MSIKTILKIGAVLAGAVVLAKKGKLLGATQMRCQSCGHEWYRMPSCVMYCLPPKGQNDCPKCGSWNIKEVAKS